MVTLGQQDLLDQSQEVGLGQQRGLCPLRMDSSRHRSEELCRSKGSRGPALSRAVTAPTWEGAGLTWLCALPSWCPPGSADPLFVSDHHPSQAWEGTASY